MLYPATLFCILCTSLAACFPQQSLYNNHKNSVASSYPTLHNGTNITATTGGIRQPPMIAITVSGSTVEGPSTGSKSQTRSVPSRIPGIAHTEMPVPGGLEAPHAAEQTPSPGNVLGSAVASLVGVTPSSLLQGGNAAGTSDSTVAHSNPQASAEASDNNSNNNNNNEATDQGAGSLSPTITAAPVQVSSLGSSSTSAQPGVGMGIPQPVVIGSSTITVIRVTITRTIAGTTRTMPAVVFGTQTAAVGETLTVAGVPVEVSAMPITKNPGSVTESGSSSTEGKTSGQSSGDEEEGTQGTVGSSAGSGAGDAGGVGAGSTPLGLIAGGSTILITAGASPTAPSLAAPAVIIAGQTAYPDPVQSGGYIIDGQTVAVGHPITLSPVQASVGSENTSGYLAGGEEGVIVSVTTDYAGETVFVYGTITRTVIPVPAPSPTGGIVHANDTSNGYSRIGSYIVSGLSTTPTGAAGIEPFTGGVAGRPKMCVWEFGVLGVTALVIYRTLWI